MLPNVICPGFQKAGTTYLFRLLRQHPEIFLPKSKELHFFSQPSVRRRGVAHYERFFREHTKEPVVMEITPRYISSESYIIDMRNVLGPDIQFIVMVRDPIKRLISHHRMRRSKGKGTLSLNEVIKRGLQDCGNTYLDQVKRGMYSEQLTLLEKHFSRDNILIVVMEKFIKDRHGCLEQILEFLQIDKTFGFNLNQPRNAGKGAQVNLWGRVYYYFPPRYRRLILNFLPEDFESSFEKYLFNQKKPLPEEKIDGDLLKELLTIYANEKEILRSKYGLEVEDWLQGDQTIGDIPY